MSATTTISRPIRKRKHRACKECRQSKLRCDIPNDGSGSCSRCRETGEKCEVDATYRRVNKKAKIDELSAQVRDLQTALKQNSTAAVPRQQPAASTNVMRTHHSVSSVGHGFFPESSKGATDNTFHKSPPSEVSSKAQHHTPLSAAPRSPSCPSRSVQSEPGVRSLDDVVLTKEQVDDLFAEYFERYHPRFEVIDPTKGPDEIFEASRFLFWTIIAIAARRFTEEPTLLADLEVSVNKLAWAEISSLHHSIYTIQALLILVTWPFPSDSEESDNTLIILGVLMQAARKLGLHKPRDRQDFLRTRSRAKPEELQEMVKVWSACNIVAESYAATSGHQSLFVHDWTIDQACDPTNELGLPDGLRHQLIIACASERISKRLSGNSFDPTGLPAEHDRMQLFQLMESEVDGLYESIFDRLDATNQIRFHGMRLQLQSFYFHDLPDPEFRNTGILKAYNTAFAFLRRLLEEDRKTNLLLYVPYEIIRTVYFAMAVISDVLRSRHFQDIDHDAGKRLFHAGLAATKKASVENNDMPGRLSLIMAQLWRKRNARPDEALDEPILRVKSRLGASLLYNWLWYWREMFAGQANAYEKPSASGTLLGDFNSSPGDLWPFTPSDALARMSSHGDPDAAWTMSWGKAFPTLEDFDMAFTSPPEAI